MSESALVRSLLLHAATHSARLYRNNVGVLRDVNGTYVRYGLCVGSSDVIGWTPVVITPAMVGRTVAVFTAYEAKTGRRVTTMEQGAFVAAVRQQGGIAAVVRSLADADAAIAAFVR